MKHGIFYFLRLNYVIWGARVAILPLIIIAINVPIMGLLFPIMCGLCILCVLISVVTFPIMPPSTTKVKEIIDGHKKDFMNRIENECNAAKGSANSVVTGYFHGSKTHLKRYIDEKVIYDHLTMVALKRVSCDLSLAIETISLLSNRPAERICININDKNNVSITTREYNSDYNLYILRIECPDICTEVIVENDYHLRDFLKFYENLI